nr:hypothetical protein B0A51_17349 [Rachicladosporium sp. CCFEE 5018]
MADSMDAQPSAAISTYEQEKSRLPLLFSDMTSGAGSRNAHREEMMYSPLISLAVKHAVDHEQHVRRTITAEMVEQAAYEASAGEHSANHSILPLLLQDHQLTNERMQRMMSVFENECKTPLYMDVIMRSLRDVALDPSPFSMVTLEALIQFQTFDRVQENFLKQRMDLLKSFCSSGARSYHTRALENAIGQATRAIINSHPPIPEFDVLQIEPGTLTIVDLSDPSISTSTACMLFDICLSIAKEKPITSGLVIALDEAHRYIDSCSAATTFTNSLLTTIR